METIVMIAVFAGMMIACVGWGSYPKKWSVVGSGLLIMFGSVFLIAPGGTGLGVMMVGGGLVLLGFSIASGKEKRAARKLEIGATPLDRFFVECVLSDCNDFSRQKNVARAKLLADKYKLSYPNGVEELYRKGLEAHKAVSDKREEDALQALRQAEREEFTARNRYAGYFGKEKKAAMLRDRMEALRRDAKRASESADLLMRSVTQQEQNWGVWGGIAEGLAGPAAGIAMALDVEAQNAKIRAQNEANCRAAMPVYMQITDNAYQNRRNAEAVEAELRALQEKLMGDMEADKVLKMLTISNVVVEVSATGAFRVSATVEAKRPLYIFGDVPAVADGTIVAHVMEDGKEIGTANLVLPVNGAAGKVGVAGIGLFGATPGKKQNVTFSAGKLWLQER